MERLTKRNPYWIENEFWTSAEEPDEVQIDDVYMKLRDYENAEENGRLLELPCKVGDIVFFSDTYATTYTGVQAYQITNIIISQNKKHQWTKKYRAMLLLNEKTIDWQLNFSFDDIGKTVFLTKKAAEAALKEMEGRA